MSAIDVNESTLVGRSRDNSFPTVATDRSVLLELYVPYLPEDLVVSLFG